MMSNLFRCNFHLPTVLILSLMVCLFSSKVEAQGQEQEVSEDYKLFHHFGIHKKLSAKEENQQNKIFQFKLEEVLKSLYSALPSLQTKSQVSCGSDEVPAKWREKKDPLQIAVNQLPEEHHFLDQVDIRKLTLDAVLAELEHTGDQEAIAIRGVPFKVHPMVTMDIPVNPIYFWDQSKKSGQEKKPFEKIFREETSRNDLEGVAEIYQILKLLVWQDPLFAKSKMPNKEFEVDRLIHLAMISRVQSFDHPVVHRMLARFKELCPQCEPIFSNKQDGSSLSFQVKDGKLLIQTSTEFLVRGIPEGANDERGRGIPQEAGEILVKRTMVIDLLSGEKSRQLIHWQKLQKN